MRHLLLALLALGAAAPGLADDRLPPPASTSSIVITLGIGGDADRKVALYQCEGRDTPMRVEYINAAPNFLALVPLDDGTIVFANVLSGSGARYAAGKWVWWTKGANADLYDITAGDNAKPAMSCAESIDTP